MKGPAPLAGAAPGRVYEAGRYGWAGKARKAASGPFLKEGEGS